jgi:hypothetical protein
MASRSEAKAQTSHGLEGVEVVDADFNRPAHVQGDDDAVFGQGRLQDFGALWQGHGQVHLAVFTAPEQAVADEAEDDEYCAEREGA